tara:strand:+ start:310 stop:735 length:426 start_codon:yes stop_codon:yes gene_type:complete
MSFSDRLQFEEFNDPNFVSENVETFKDYVLVPIGVGAGIASLGYFGSSIFNDMAYNGSGFGGVVQPFVREGIIEYSQNLPSSQWNFGQPNFINPNPYGPSGPNPVDIGVTINNLGDMLRESRILATANNQALDRIMLGYQM